MTNPTFTLVRTRFDEDYQPEDGTRLTTNFANLARGEDRRQNLRSALRMIDDRFNQLMRPEGAEAGDRYALELDIISVNIELGEAAPADSGGSFPLIEMLQTTILDRETGRRTPGIVGNNFSSYVRDYDFSVLLPEHGGPAGLPEDFGELHGNLYRSFLSSEAYARSFEKRPVICISVSSSRTYRRTGHQHPVLGVEYRQDEYSLTDRYFAKMGMEVRYFMPPHGAAPLALYFTGDLTADYTELELAATIATMETFQKIYRPEIYAANSPAGEHYRPSLDHADHTPTGIVYDREERSRLGQEQGRYAQEKLILPFGDILEQWAARHSTHQTSEGTAS